jgi:hypothetical protein
MSRQETIPPSTEALVEEYERDVALIARAALAARSRIASDMAAARCCRAAGLAARKRLFDLDRFTKAGRLSPAEAALAMLREEVEARDTPFPEGDADPRPADPAAAARTHRQSARMRVACLTLLREALCDLGYGELHPDDLGALIGVVDVLITAQRRRVRKTAQERPDAPSR